MSEVLDSVSRKQVVASTVQFVERAGRHFGEVYPVPAVYFDLQGRSAGMFVVRGDTYWIRYNPWIFARYYAQNLATTVPHEVAHYIVYQRCGLRGVKPHGRQWRELMALFGAAADVTFDLDLSGLPQRRQRRHAYGCDCGEEHALSTTRHKRVQQGRAAYRCRRCGAVLAYRGVAGA